MSAPVPWTDPVAIVGGTGALGSALAVRLAATGVPVRIGSRDAGRAAEAAARIAGEVAARDDRVERPGDVTGSGNAEAASAGEVVVLAVPFREQSETLTSLRHVLRPGQLLLDATVPLAAAVSGKATRTVGVWQGSAAQQAAEMVPDGVRVVAALHTVSARTLRGPGPLDEDVLVCGDDASDKTLVAALLARIPGLRPVDAGPLEQARIVESLTALLIGVNARHRAHAGIRITGLDDAVRWPPPPTDPDHEDSR